MKAHWIQGLAIALLGSALGMSDARADWPTPTTPCNESNMFTFTALSFYGPVRRRYLNITYWCNGMEWQAYMVCDPKRQPSCEIVIT